MIGMLVANIKADLKCYINDILKCLPDKPNAVLEVIDIEEFEKVLELEFHQTIVVSQKVRLYRNNYTSEHNDVAEKEEL
ncbi:hypothetical protein RUND412_010241 [Rhizina undulata]